MKVPVVSVSKPYRLGSNEFDFCLSRLVGVQSFGVDMAACEHDLPVSCFVTAIDFTSVTETDSSQKHR